MKKKKIIPFRFLPAAWGLSGKSYDEAEANYYLVGEELDCRLAEINFSGKELESKKNAINLKYKKISNEDFDLAEAELKYSGLELELKKLEISFNHEKISEKDYKKSVATLNKEPWVGYDGDDYDKAQGVSGYYFKLDWNEFFIHMLRGNGYNGYSDEDVIESWFNDLNRGYIGEMLEDDIDGLETDVATFKVKKQRTDDGKKTTYS